MARRRRGERRRGVVFVVGERRDGVGIAHIMDGICLLKKLTIVCVFVEGV